MGCIYKVTNLMNKKVYIGMTTNTMQKRRTVHKMRARNHKDWSYFYGAVNKYGWENFTWEIIFETNDPEELAEYELEAMYEHNSVYPDGYNLNLQKRRILTPELREKYRQNALGNQWRKGKKCTPEARERMKISNRGKCNRMNKKVRCITTNQEFSSISEAARYFKMSIGSVRISATVPCVISGYLFEFT